MQVAERTKPRKAVAGWWLLLGLSAVMGLWVSTFLGGAMVVGFLFFGLVLVASLIRAYGAWTGVKRFGTPAA